MICHRMFQTIKEDGNDLILLQKTLRQEQMAECEGSARILLDPIPLFRRNRGYCAEQG